MAVQMGAPYNNSDKEAPYGLPTLSFIAITTSTTTNQAKIDLTIVTTMAGPLLECLFLLSLPMALGR